MPSAQTDYLQYLISYLQTFAYSSLHILMTILSSYYITPVAEMEVQQVLLIPLLIISGELVTIFMDSMSKDVSF